MADHYNRIVLIGNGFDRAAGLNTSYKNFIDAVVKNAVIKAIRSNLFDSELLTIEIHGGWFSQPFEAYTQTIMQLSSAKAALEYIDKASTITFKFDFFREIINSLEDARWVDLEQFYFDKLKSHYNRYFKGGQGRSTMLRNIQNLNLFMNSITEELHNYIQSEQSSNPMSLTNPPLVSIIEKCQFPLREEVSSLVSRHNRSQEPTNIIFLNFNYTDTIETHLQDSSMKPDVRHIHIHGAVSDSSNPIIFGYGDDTGEDYRKLEFEGENDLLRKIKSFQYPRTRNYHNLLNVLENYEYDVFIIGHSCGLSDRTLLKTIFEHPNCLAIQNFHYKGESEDFEKRMEISRHFTDKVLMRERVLPFDKEATIPQSK